MSADDFRPSRFLDSERGFTPALSREDFETRRRVFTERALATLNTGDIEHASDFTVGSQARLSRVHESTDASAVSWKTVAVCALLAGGGTAATLYSASSVKPAPSGQLSVASLEDSTLTVPAFQPVNKLIGAFEAKAASNSLERSTGSPRTYGETAGLPVATTVTHNKEAANAPAAAQRPVSLFTGYSSSSASLTSAGPFPHPAITWITEMLSTTNQFTALWILVVAVAFILEIGAGLVRGLLWFAGGNGRDLCTSIWSTFLPEESESGEVLLGMRAQLDTLESALRERAGMMESQKCTIKLIEGELQRSMDAEYTLRKENRKLKKELNRSAANTPRDSPVNSQPSPARDPATAVLHTKVEESNVNSPRLITPKPRIPAPVPSVSQSPSTLTLRSAPFSPPIPTPPLPTAPGAAAPRPGPRPPVPHPSFSPWTTVNCPPRNSSSPGSATTPSLHGNDRTRFRNPSAAMVGVIGRAMSESSTCTDSYIGVAVNISPEGSPVSVKSSEHPLE